MADEIRELIRGCTNCHLHSTHHGPAPGIIGKQYGIMVIGEAPGHEEDLAHMPFVGKSGRYLRMKLKEAGLPSKYLSFANMISCRPTGKNNRNPRDDELAACRPNILAQVMAAKPRIIITVGAISSRLFYPNIRPMYDHGRPVWIKKGQVQVPTYHPAFVLRKKKEWEWVFEEDLKAISKRAYGRLEGDWPEDCRICNKPVTKYDTFGLAYCDEHYIDSMKVTMQMGMV